MTINRRRALGLGMGAAALTAVGETPALASADGTAPSPTTTSVPGDAALAASLDGGFSSRYLTVNGVRLHYVAGGQGAPLILLPGWPQTWWEYRKVMPALAAAGRRVIALDLRGMGGSDKPAGGYDKKTMAGDVYAFIRALGYTQVDIAGHDIGSMVAFSFAANYPQAARRVAMLDVVHPDSSYYQVPMLAAPGAFSPWWFAFNQVVGLPEELLAGRAQYLIDWMFDHSLVNQDAVTAFDRAVYSAAYNSPGAIRGSNGWYQAFGQDVVDLGTYGKVTAPVLGLVDSAFAPWMQGSLPNETTDLRIVVVPNTGHYFVEEQPQAVIDQFNQFFV